MQLRHQSSTCCPLWVEVHRYQPTPLDGRVVVSEFGFMDEVGCYGTSHFVKHHVMNYGQRGCNL